MVCRSVSPPPCFSSPFYELCVCVRNFRREHRNPTPPPENSDLDARNPWNPNTATGSWGNIPCCRIPFPDRALRGGEKEKKKKKANKTSPRTRPRVSHPTPPRFHCASKEQNQNCINDISLWNLKIYTREREKKKKEERICSPRFSTLRSEKGKINDRSIDLWNEASGRRRRGKKKNWIRKKRNANDRKRKEGK